MSKVDPEVNAFIEGTFSDLPNTDPEVDPPDALDKFMESAALAGRLGRAFGWNHVARLEEETQDINARFSKLTPGAQPNPWPSALSKADDNLDAEIIPDDSRLEKSGDRRKRSLTAWLRSELALGKSAQEYIDYAARYDLETANILRTIAAELGAA